VAFEQASLRLYGQELGALCHQGAEQPGQRAQMENNMGRGSLASGTADDGEGLQSLWLGKCA